MNVTKTLYYCVHVSCSGREKFRWSEACDTAAEATAIGRERLDSEQAIRFFLVRFSGGKKEILINSVEPLADRKAIKDYLDLDLLILD